MIFYTILNLVFKKILLTLFLLLLLSNVATAFTEYTIPESDFTLVKNPERRECMIYAIYNSGSALSVIQSKHGWAILIRATKNNKWDPNIAKAKLNILFDNKVWTIDSFTVDDNFLIFVVDPSEKQLITDMSRANGLHLYINTDYVFGLSLKGSSKALTALGECYDNYAYQLPNNIKPTPEVINPPRRFGE